MTWKLVDSSGTVHVVEGEAALLALCRNHKLKVTNMRELVGDGREGGEQACKDGWRNLLHLPWLQHATLRDNILFGGRFDADLYARVLHACIM